MLYLRHHQRNKVNTMHRHNQTYTPDPKPSEEHASKAQEIIVALACLALFAFWGVLLALGV